jgi:hypothetical protein
MTSPDDQNRQLRREAMRKLPSLMGHTIRNNVAAAVLLLFLTSGGQRAPSQTATWPLELLRHPLALAIWAAGPSAFIWLFFSSMAAVDSEGKPIDVPTRLVALAMIAVHLLCVGGLWVFLR